jgi:hypothetical protein
MEAAAKPPPYAPSSVPASAASPAVIVMEVADAGAGLTAEDCERIFNAFERAAPEKGGGTGLGLHISRAFARAMGGDVTVASQVDAGSTCVCPSAAAFSAAISRTDGKLTRCAPVCSGSRCACLCGCSQRRRSNQRRLALLRRSNQCCLALRHLRLSRLKPLLSARSILERLQKSRAACRSQSRRARQRRRPPAPQTATAALRLCQWSRTTRR